MNLSEGLEVRESQRVWELYVLRYCCSLNSKGLPVRVVGGGGGMDCSWIGKAVPATRCDRMSVSSCN